MEPIKIKKDEKYDVMMCANCLRQQHKGKIVETPNLEEAIYNKIEQRFKKAKKVELFIPEHKQNAGVNVEAEAIVDNVVVPFMIRYTLCSKCIPAFGRAFNGILQLRNPVDEIEKFIQSEIDRSAITGVHLIKREEVQGGIDYKLSSAPFTRQLGKKLQNKYGGELKETARLITQDNMGNELWRVTVLFRNPSYRKGDIVKYNGRDVKVLNFSHKVYVQDLLTHKKQQVPYDRIK